MRGKVWIRGQDTPKGKTLSGRERELPIETMKETNKMAAFAYFESEIW